MCLGSSPGHLAPGSTHHLQSGRSQRRVPRRISASDSVGCAGVGCVTSSTWRDPFPVGVGGVRGEEGGGGRGRRGKGEEEERGERREKETGQRKEGRRKGEKERGGRRGRGGNNERGERRHGGTGRRRRE